MKSAMGFALLAVILLTGTISPAVLAQIPDLAGNVIINEVELNPPGSDSRSTSNASSNVNEFVELYNPTDSAIDVSGWQLIPSKSWKSYTIPSGSLIEPNDHAVFMASSFWFDDIGDFVTLKDSAGVIVDQTPLLEDPADDMNSWQRVYDGLDTDSSSDWVLEPATGLSSNGKYIAEDIDTELTISLEIDKEQYNFNEKVNISGSVSELAHNQEFSSTTFMPEQVIIFINGPGSYSDKITVYPDTNLQFSTSLSLYSVFGYSEGEYSITANYSTATTSTDFTLGEVEDDVAAAATASELSIYTDKSEYGPGEWVIVSASTNNQIDYVGLKYTISDSKGTAVSTGTIFPNTDNEFTTKYFVPVTVNAFGVYQVFANYQFTTQFSQTGDSQSALTTFTVFEDEKEDELISIWTDKELYTPGDIVQITGRSNSIHVDTFNILIEQTGVQNAFSANEGAIRADPINLLQTVRLDGESKFGLSFQIPSVDESLGTYKITAGENFGKGYGYFKVVSNHETYVALETT